MQEGNKQYKKEQAGRTTSKITRTTKNKTNYKNTKNNPYPKTKKGCKTTTLFLFSKFNYLNFDQKASLALRVWSMELGYCSMNQVRNWAQSILSESMV